MDSSKNVSITGTTESSDLPAVNAYDSTFNGYSSVYGLGDVFVTKLFPGTTTTTTTNTTTTTSTSTTTTSTTTTTIVGNPCQCPTGIPKGCVSGMVTNKKTGAPLAGKTVRVKRTSPRKPRVRQNAITDSNGCYSVTGLADGTYKVWLKKADCKGRKRRKKNLVISRGTKINDVNLKCR